MDFPWGVNPDHPDAYSRDEGLAGPSPLFGEISIRVPGRPGAARALSGEMLRFLAIA